MMCRVLLFVECGLHAGNAPCRRAIPVVMVMKVNRVRTLLSVCVIVATMASTVGHAQTAWMEREYKLHVPLHMVEEVWQYLHDRYGGDEPLHNALGLPVQLSVTFNDEHFIDRYYDTSDLRLLRMDSGLRHRQRFVHDNHDDPRHNRQRLQIKLDRPDQQGNLIRTEVTFRGLSSDRSIRHADDLHPVLSLVRRSERDTLREVMHGVGVDANDLQEALVLNQSRRRVYLHRGNVMWGQLSLDVVESSKWWHTVRFAMIEIANDEMTYHIAPSEKQAWLEHLQDEMKADLLRAFPELQIDLTPKYSHTFRLFDERFLWFPLAMRYQWPMEVVLASMVGIVIVGATVLVRRALRRAKKPTFQVIQRRS